MAVNFTDLYSAVSAFAAPTAPRITFADHALPMVAKGIPVIPLEPGSKETHVGAKAATLDRNVVNQWNAAQPDANCGCVAQAVPGGIWYLETDSSDLAEKYRQETGREIPK